MHCTRRRWAAFGAGEAVRPFVACGNIAASAKATSTTHPKGAVAVRVGVFNTCACFVSGTCRFALIERDCARLLVIFVVYAFFVTCEVARPANAVVVCAGYGGGQSQQ